MKLNGVIDINKKYLFIFFLDINIYINIHILKSINFI